MTQRNQGIEQCAFIFASTLAWAADPPSKYEEKWLYNSRDTMALHLAIARPYLEAPFCAAPLAACVEAALVFASKQAAYAEQTLVINIDGRGKTTAVSAIVAALRARGARVERGSAVSATEVTETAETRRCIVVDVGDLVGSPRRAFRARLAAAPCPTIRVQECHNASQPAIFVC